MDTLVHADIFFFIAAVSTILIAILAIIALVYLIRILKSISSVSSTLERGVHHVSSNMDKVAMALLGKKLFNLFFGKQKARKSSKKS